MTVKLHNYFHIPANGNDSETMEDFWILHNTLSYNPVGSNTTLILLKRVSKISAQIWLVKNKLTVKITMI